MPTLLSEETIQELQRYRRGELSNADLADWLAAAEYDSELETAERDALASLAMVVVEANEGSREASEILDKVTEMLAEATPGEQVLAFRTDASTSWSGDAVLTAESQTLRAGISL